VWDGVGNYRSRPPRKLIKQLQGEVTVAQIEAPMTGERSAVEAIEFFTESYDGVVLWARNRKVYQSIVDELKQSATLAADGTTNSGVIPNPMR
jgi:hypothetical protein